MRLPFESFWQKQHVLVPLNSAHSAAVAAIHIEGFHRPWNDGEFRSLLAQENVFGFVALVEGRPKAPPAGFILARLAAGEAEILTVAVAKSVRRHGIGQRLVDETLRKLHAERAQSLFLEVDGGNIAAVKLYNRFGFKKVAERPAYYDGPDGKAAALVMRLDLG
jgi:[ribosomal protein S18]-alanine N-acetyltransferase